MDGAAGEAEVAHVGVVGGESSASNGGSRLGGRHSSSGSISRSSRTDSSGERDGNVGHTDGTEGVRVENAERTEETTRGPAVELSHHHVVRPQ